MTRPCCRRPLTAGKYITDFNGRAGSAIDAIGPFTCNDGTTLPLIGSAGGGGAWASSDPTGYSAVSIRFSNAIDYIIVVAASKGLVALTGGGSAGNDVRLEQCPPGWLIAGVSGTYTASGPVQLALTCRSGKAAYSSGSFSPVCGC